MPPVTPGTPTPPPPQPPQAPSQAAVLGGQDAASLRKQVEEMERLTASSREQAQGIMQEIEDKELRQTLGLDIEFDVSKLITQGIVEKRGLKIVDGLWVDMHTLTKEEDILSEQLVEQVYESMGGIKLSKGYYEAKASAMLAMAITRCNNKLFPAPPTEAAKQKTEEFKRSWDDKVSLFHIILKFPSSLVDSLSFVYMNLEKADVLLEEKNKKKSSRP
jgi:hypothetical protein